MLKLTWRNTLRHPLRASLTILGMAVAVLAFCLLRTVVAAWYAGVAASSPVRLVTRNAVSLMFPLPLADLGKIQAVPGVVRVAYAYWFEGIYIDQRHFFPQFAASLPAYLDAYPEYLIPADQKLALIQDRRGAVASWRPGSAGAWGRPSSSRAPISRGNTAWCSGPSIGGGTPAPMRPSYSSIMITSTRP
jgi:putative ABC transport system permease protein